MNNTSNSNSKAKLIGIIAGLLVVILTVAIALTFILKQHQNKVITETAEINTKQNMTKDIKTTIQDSTSKESIPEEADKTSDEAEQAGDMNGDTTTGVEITDEMKEYNESPESTVTKEDNTAECTEEPKQEEVYVPDSTPRVDDTPQVDNTPVPTPTPEAPADNTPASSGSDDSFWGGSDTNQDINWDSEEHGWGDTKGWTWQGDVFSDTPEGQTYGDPGWKANGTWHY